MKVTAPSDSFHIWPGKPVQLNRQTAAWAGLFLIAALGLGLNLGLHQFSGREQPKELRQAPNFYVQTNVPENRKDYSYENLTQPPAEQPVIAEQAASSAANHAAPDPRAEVRRREDEAARQSGLFPEGTRDLGRRLPAALGSRSKTRPLSGLDLASLQLPSVQGLLPGQSSSAAERRQAFLAGGDIAETYLQHRLQEPLSDFEIKAGTVIPAALLTGLNSDLPGQIIGQVTENIFDTPTGRYLLIPQGSKIFGRYNADIAFGQNRAQIVWDRLILPNGDSIQLEAMIGADKAGYAGLADQVDHHAGRLFGAILLSSFITSGANLISNSDDNGFTEDLGDAAAQQAVNIGSDIVERQLDVQPTITVRPGFKLNILVNEDMAFSEPYRG